MTPDVVAFTEVKQSPTKRRLSVEGIVDKVSFVIKCYTVIMLLLDFHACIWVEVNLINLNVELLLCIHRIEEYNMTFFFYYFVDLS